MALKFQKWGNTMNKSLKNQIKNYLDLRRGFGFKLKKDERLLYNFYDFLTRKKSAFITTALALEFACQNPSVSHDQWAKRLGIIRIFSKYMKAIDLRTEIPPRSLLPLKHKRPPPFIFSDENIKDMLRTCADLEYKHDIDRYSYYTVFGLIAVTGMRLGEALGLENDSVDLNEGILTVRNSKFNKSRCLPIHPTTVRVLREYRMLRDQHLKNEPISFFVDRNGNSLKEYGIRKIFHQILEKLGSKIQAKRKSPRIMDLRHSFAVKVLARWYQQGLDVDLHIPLLSTYMGHVLPSLTYWYLTGTPQLLKLALFRLENYKGGSK